MNKRSLIFVIGLTVALYFVNQYFSSKEQERKQERQTETVKVAPPVLPLPAPLLENVSGEKYYVLENGFQQLVFSNVGGSLVEINLPIKSKENPASDIKSIRVDKIMEADYAKNDHFPEFAYQKPDGSEQTGAVGGYYPLLRRSIVGKTKENPRYYALNVIGNEERNLVYNVTKYEKDMIVFEGVSENRKIVKTFSFPKEGKNAPYCFDLSLQVEGDARGLMLTSGVPEVELISGNPAPALKYQIQRGRRPNVELIDLPKTSSTVNSIEPKWICNSNGFFGLILNPLTEMGGGFSASKVPGASFPTRLTLVDSEYDLYPAEKYPGYEMGLFLPQAPNTSQFRVFAGPFVTEILETVDATYGVYYKGAQSFHGWFSFISEPFAKFLMILMKFFYFITHSWGFSIILLTVALRVMLYPLNSWSIRSTVKMQQVAPQVTAIQEKYKKEPKKAQMEVMALYKAKGVNPITGCFPILIQMPFLIGMFDLLKSAFELRGAVFIPGWIDNLTAPDVLFSWNYPVIFFGTNFHLLPIILGVVMYYQQRLGTSRPKDPKLMTDQQKQQKTMGNIMTLVFAIMFYHFPSGLNLYWLSSMILGIVQQWWMMKKMAATPATPANPKVVDITPAKKK